MVSRTKLAVVMGSIMLLTALLALGLATVSAAPGVDLVIDKWSDPYAPGPVIAGEELFYHVSVWNNGDSTATNVLVTDTLPYGVSYIDNTDDCTYDSGLHRLVCDLGELDPSEYREFFVKVRVDPWAVMEEWDGTIVLENSAVVGSSEDDDDPSDNTVTHSIFAEGSADLSVTKMSKPDTHVRAGELFTYTIYVENLGPSVAQFVGMRDELLSSGAFEIVDFSTDRDDYGTVECFLESTEPGISNTLFCMNWFLEPLGLMPLDMGEEFSFDTGRWTINVVLRANETQDVNDVAQVFPLDGAEEFDGEFPIGTRDPDWSNNTAEDFIYVTDVADLSIEKSLTLCPQQEGYCVAGGWATFAVTVTNFGPSTAENVVVEDLLPSGVTVADVSGAGACTTGIPGDPFAPLTCNLGTILPLDSRSFNVTVDIDPDYPLSYSDLSGWVGSLENNAWVYSDIFDPDNGNNRDHVIQQIYAYSNLGAWKECPESVVGGQEFDYLVSIENFGPSTVHNLFLNDPLHEGLAFVDYEILMGDGFCYYNADQHRVACSLGDVDPGETTVVKLTVRVRPDYDGTLIYNDLEGGVWADTYFEVGEEWPYCETQVQLLTDLSIQKSVEPLKVYPGDEQLYHVQVTNIGPMDAVDVIVTDTLPAEVDYEIDTDNCDLFSEDPDVLECHLGTIPGGQTAAFDISVLVAPDYFVTQTVELMNTALVSMPYDTNPDNNTASVTNLMLVPTSADLGLQKSWEQAPPEWFDGAPFAPEDCYPNEGVVRAGCPLRYTLQVTNTGPLLAENVVVEDVVPAGVTVEGAGSSQGSCTTGIPGDPSAPLTCNLGNIPRDEGAGIEVFVRTDADLAWEMLENDAVVSSDIPDPDNGNNRSNVLIWVEPFSYLYLDKQGPPEIMAGEEIQYWINLRNEGPSTAHDVHLEDELPGGVSLVDAQVMIGDGSCEPDSALCSLGDVEPGANRAVRVRGYVEAWLEAETVITNTVRAWADSPFYQPVPDQPISDTVETLVHSAADLSIRKTADPYKVYAGEQVRYDVAVTNNGPAVAHNVVVTDTLDPGVEYEIDTIGCDHQPAIMLGASQPFEGGELFSVDLGSGAGSYIGDMPEWLAAEIEYDNTSGRLFAAEGFRPWYDDDAGPPRLYELDPTTGAEIGYVELDEYCALPGLEFVDGTLFGACNYDPDHDGGMPHLVTVDPDTGDVDEVDSGPVIDEYSLIHGLAWDKSARVMYGLVIQEGPNELVTIDLDTGEGEYLCQIWDDDYSDYAYDLRAIEFGPDGQLYGGIATDSDLVIIDQTPQEDNGQYCNMHHVGDTGYSVSGLTLMGESDVACHLGEIPPGETATFSIWARVKPDTLGMINNRVDVMSDTEDPNPDNNWDTEANLVLGKADLRVLKYGKPDGIVEAGDRLTYTVIVDNLGPGYAHDVVLYDLFSSSSWAYYVDDWRSDRPADCSWDEWGRDTRITCHLDNPLEVMSPDSSGRWVLKFYLEVFEEQSVNNVAQVVGSDYDPDLSNNYAIVEHEITAVADLELNKIAEGEVLVGCEGETELWENEVAAGGMLYYTLQIYNDGPSTAENVVVEDWGISPFLDIVDVECEKDDSWRSCSCNLSGLGELGDTNRHLICYLGEIDEDDEDQITITARIPSDVPEGTRLVNDARVYSDVFDDDNGDNLASNWTKVSRWADLEVVKTQEPEIALPGQHITYSITVTNLGLSDAEGVFISDTIPVEVLDLTWTCCASDGQCDVPCEPPTCPAGDCPRPDIGLFAQADIPAGEWVIYTVEGTLDWWPCGPFTNTVELIPPQSLLHPDTDIDPCDENNVDEAVNDPFCHFDPLVLKDYPGSDSPP